MTPAERSSASNGIWLCAVCALRIDVDSQRFPRELLLAWKHEAEAEAHRQLGKPRSTHREEQLKQQEPPFVCPHCNTGFMRAQTVCTGCHGQIVEGATHEERKTAKTTGFMLSALPQLFICHEFGINLLPIGEGSVAYIPLFVLVFSSLYAGGLVASFEEKRRRKKNPRVFVRTYV